MPFPYPPPYLLMVTPYGALPFWAAFPLWIVLLTTIFYLVFRRFVSRPYVFAHPALFPNVLVGQNGLLTASILYGGLSLPKSKGMAGRRDPWRAHHQTAARRSSPGRLDCRAILAGHRRRRIVRFAPDIDRARSIRAGNLPRLFRTYPRAGGFAVRPHSVAQGRQFLWGLADHSCPGRTGNGASCWPGCSIAAAAAWLAWSRRYDTRIPILAAASLLISPYLFNYDSVLLLIPIGWLIVQRKRPLIIIALWALSAIALFAKMPNPTFIAATIALFVMLQEARAEIAEETNLRPEYGGGR